MQLTKSSIRHFKAVRYSFWENENHIFCGSAAYRKKYLEDIPRALCCEGPAPDLPRVLKGYLTGTPHVFTYTKSDGNLHLFSCNGITLAFGRFFFPAPPSTLTIFREPGELPGFAANYNSYLNRAAFHFVNLRSWDYLIMPHRWEAKK